MGTYNSEYYDQDKINKLSEIAINDLDSLFDELEVKLHKSGDKYYGQCPIHDGDNPMALNFYYGGHSVPVTWSCRTHHCEQQYKKTLVGFIRGVLSTQKGSLVSFKESVDWLCRFTKQNIKNLKATSDKEKRFFSNKFGREKINGVLQLNRIDVLKNLTIPPKFYLQRGYSEDILRKYDIGLCTNPAKPMFNRVVFPIYDNDHRYIVGCTARSIHTKCEACNLYHDGKCPSEYKFKYHKWLSNTGFNKGSHLYNYWFAKKEIEERRNLFIVEGPGDSLKLSQAGIMNNISLLGSDLSDEQQIILERSGAMNIFLLLDPDDAGNIARDNITIKLQRLFNIKNIYLPDERDIGDLNSEEIKLLLKDYL